MRWLVRARAWWNVSDCCQYSPERLGAFSAYATHHALARALLVILFYPLPSLAFAIALDVMPLAAPTLAWDGNNVFWIRLFVTLFVITFGTMLQVRQLVPAAQLSMRECTVVSVLAAIPYTAMAFTVASFWTFPIPFMPVIGNIPWVATVVIAVRCVIGRKQTVDHTELHIQQQRFLSIVGMASIFMVIFPVYSAVFRVARGDNQLALIVLLPLLKITLKRVVKILTVELQDLVSVIAITIDLFNALFQVCCMQNASSMWTSVGVVALDTVQNTVSLLKLQRLVRELQTAVPHEIVSVNLLLLCTELIQLDATASAAAACNTNSNGETTEVVAANASAVSRMPHELKTTTHDVKETSARRTVSTELRPPAAVSKTQLVGVAPAPLSSVRNIAHRLWTLLLFYTTASASVAPIQVQPLSPQSLVPPLQTASMHATTLIDCTDRTLVTQKALHLLCKCESMLLVEYIEVVVPLMYGVSLAVVHALPSAQFYPGMRGMTTEALRTVLVSVLVYTLLELVSLLLVHAILRRAFGISALHQIAFVLEHDWLIVQGLFFTWVTTVLGITLEHYGMDFSFKFEWMK